MAEEARLIRFVAGPGGAGGSRPGRASCLGRGMWVAADRASVQTAAKKGLFSRSAKDQARSPLPDLADQVDRLLAKRRLLDGLGLAKTRPATLSRASRRFWPPFAGRKAGWPGLMRGRRTAEPDGRRKILFGAARQVPEAGLGLIGTYDASAELGLALGGENVIHTALLKGRATNRWTSDAQRLSGFRPLLPESWREEPREGGS